MIPGPGDVRYLVLTDRATPYLLARVRWPDVAQAITVGSPDWLDDVGLFDLPYNPGAVRLTFTQAASVAAAWGRQLTAEPADGVPSFIRRLPANWSDLSPAERRALGLDSIGRQRASARRIRRLHALQAKSTASAPGAPGAARRTSRATAPAERRRHMRVRVDGRAHIRLGRGTLSAGLVDLSAGGVRCVMPEASPEFAPGWGSTDRSCSKPRRSPRGSASMCRAGIMWSRTIGASTHFGVTFRELGDSETDGVRHFIAAACSRSLAR